MDTLPEEVLLHIFSYLPVKILFIQVSRVSKTFHRAVFDSSTLKARSKDFAKLRICNPDEGKAKKLHQILEKVPKGTIKSLTIKNWASDIYFMHVLKDYCSNTTILNISRASVNISKNVLDCFPFQHLRELNVSNTKIDDAFLIALGKTCLDLFSLNISHCGVITHTGIENADLSLNVINISSCTLLNGFSVIHSVRNYEAILVCMRNLTLTPQEEELIDSLFPDVLEIGIPNLCGFSYMGYVCPFVCPWCSSKTRETFL